MRDSSLVSRLSNLFNVRETRGGELEYIEKIGDEARYRQIL